MPSKHEWKGFPFFPMHRTLLRTHFRKQNISQPVGIKLSTVASPRWTRNSGYINFLFTFSLSLSAPAFATVVLTIEGHSHLAAEGTRHPAMAHIRPNTRTVGGEMWRGSSRCCSLPKTLPPNVCWSDSTSTEAAMGSARPARPAAALLSTRPGRKGQAPELNA